MSCTPPSRPIRSNQSTSQQTRNSPTKGLWTLERGRRTSSLEGSRPALRPPLDAPDPLHRPSGNPPRPTSAPLALDVSPISLSKEQGQDPGFHRPQTAESGPPEPGWCQRTADPGAPLGPAAASTVRQRSIPSTCSGRGHTRASTAAASLLFPPGHSPHPGRGLTLTLEPTLRSRLRLQLGRDLGQVMFVCPVSPIPRSPPRTIINLEGLAPALRELSIRISCDYLTCPEPRQMYQPALIVW